MIKKKVLIPLIVIFIVVSTLIIFFYPVQKMLALKKFNEYIELQGVVEENIVKKKIAKNYTEGGYTIIVTYKDDPKHKYWYQYFLMTHRKHEDRKFHRMDCDVIDLDRNLVLDPPYNDSVKYPSLGYQ